MRSVDFTIGKSGCRKSITSKTILGISAKQCTANDEIIFDTNAIGKISLLKLRVWPKAAYEVFYEIKRGME